LNPSPFNPHEPASLCEFEQLIGKSATKDFGPGTLDNWRKSWSVYCTLLDGVEKGSITPTKPVYFPDRGINPILTEIPLSALLIIAERRGDAGEIVASLQTWYEPVGLELPSATECRVVATLDEPAKQSDQVPPALAAPERAAAATPAELVSIDQLA